MKEWLKRQARNVRKLVAVGVGLLVVPTAFTVLGELQELAVAIRVIILIAWIAVAALAIWAAAERDVVVTELAEDRKRLRHDLRLTATSQVLASLLHPGAKNIPEHYEFTVYIFDEKQLTPFWPIIDFTDDPDPRVFQPGKGATGTAWERGTTVVVRGTDVANEKYGLTPEQQQFFQGYRTAVATPILEEGTGPFGVLTCLGREDDEYFSDETGPGQDSLRSLADVLAVVLTAIPESGDLLG